MEAVFLSIILIHICGVETRYYSSSSSSSSWDNSFIAAIVIPTVVGLILCIVIPMICAKKRGKRRMGVLPLSTQIALAQQENVYAPPSFHQPPPYGQPSPYNQPPPYGQLPPYGQTPPYPVASAPSESTKTKPPS